MERARRHSFALRRLREALAERRGAAFRQLRRPSFAFGAFFLACAFALTRGCREESGVGGRTRVLCARHAVAPGQPVTALDFRATTARGAEEGAVSDQELDRVGERRTVRPLSAGQCLRWNDLESETATLAARIPRGRRAFALPEPLPFRCSRGDRLDLFVGKNDDTEPATLVASAAEVLSAAGEGPVVVAVLPAVFRVLEEGSRRGRIAAALRPAGEREEPLTPARRRNVARRPVVLSEEEP